MMSRSILTTRFVALLFVFTLGLLSLINLSSPATADTDAETIPMLDASNRPVFNMMGSRKP